MTNIPPYNAAVRIVGLDHRHFGKRGVRVHDAGPFLGHTPFDGRQHLVLLEPDTLHPHGQHVPVHAHEIREEKDLPTWGAMYRMLLGIARQPCKRTFYGDDAMTFEGALFTREPLTCIGIREYVLANPHREEQWVKGWYDKVRAKQDYCPVCQAADVLGLRTTHPWKD